MSAGGNKHGGSGKHGGHKGSRRKHHPKSKKPKNPLRGIQMFPGGPRHHPAVHHKKQGPGGWTSPPPLPGMPGAFGAPLLIGDVHCCTAEALASSLRMAGWPVGDEDILALYFLTTDDPIAQTTIPAMLEAASRFGLAGVRPIDWDRIGDEAFQPGDIQGLELLDGRRHVVTLTRAGQWSWGSHWSLEDLPGYAEETWTVRWPR